MRGVFYVSAAEMAAGGLSALLSSFGFNYTNGVTVAPVTGSMVVYFQLTNDATNTKSNIFATAITGMTTVYNGNMTIPVAATATFVDLPLASAFNYTGGAMYVAYDWISAGPFTNSLTPATYAANNSIAGGGLTAAANSSVAPATLGSTAFRPAFRFGSVNTVTNDVSVNYIATPAILATSNGTSHAVQALVNNNSNTTLNNIPVSLNVSGAVTFANTFTVASLAAGNTASVTFAPFPISSGLTGINTINVSVPNDQINTNNLQSWTQTLTCNVQALGPNVTSTTFTNGIGFNTGSGLLLNRVQFAGTNTLVSTDIAISSPTTNLSNSLYAVVCNSLGTILATSNTITVGNANLGVYNTFTFAPTQVLASTDYYIGLAQPSNT